MLTYSGVHTVNFIEVRVCFLPAHPARLFGEIQYLKLRRVEHAHHSLFTERNLVLRRQSSMVNSDFFW